MNVRHPMDVLHSFFLKFSCDNMQHQVRTAIQENNFGLLLEAYKALLQLYFYFNLHNYPHCSSYIKYESY